MKNKKQSLFNKFMEDESFKKKYEAERSLFEIEYQLARIMEHNGITQQELADRLEIDKSVISKDLSGALKKAGMKKLNAIAEALNCDFIPLFIPKEDKNRHDKIASLLNQLLMNKV